MIEYIPCARTEIQSREYCGKQSSLGGKLLAIQVAFQSLFYTLDLKNVEVCQWENVEGENKYTTYLLFPFIYR
jgi:hypothetical protein